MAYLTKEQYAYRQESAAKKMVENATIAQEKGMTEEQTDILEELCSFRHDFHCNMSKLVNDNTDTFKELLRIREELVKSGLPKLDIGRFDEGLYIDIDDFQVVYETEQVPDNDTQEFDEWYEKTYSRIYDELSELHKMIEDYLSNIDKKYGTNYCPTGALRIF